MNVNLHRKSDKPTPGGGSGSAPLGGPTKIFIPSVVTLGANDTFYPVTPQATITATLTLSGTIQCTYSVKLPTTGAPYPATPLPLQGTCTNGMGAGSIITTGSAVLSGSEPLAEDATFHANATLALDMDDGNPCTLDYCSGGIIHNDAAPLNGKLVGNSDPCSAPEICVSGGATTNGGSAPPSPIYVGCTKYTCVANQGYVGDSSTCSAVGNLGSYPGNGTVPSDFAGGAAFLYASGGPQTGLANVTISSLRAAIIRGRVVSQTGAPLQGVTVSVLSRPEYGVNASYGSVISRSDGYYDLAVNGGATYTVQYALASTASYPHGFVTAQRTVATRWLDFSVVHDVMLIPKDVSTSVTKNASTWTMVRGTKTTTDSDSSRQATLLIPNGTSANGVTGSTYTMRATELTITNSGAISMPGDLPPQSGYTYAVELGLDEAETQSVSPVTFSNSYGNYVFFYLENFTSEGLGSNTTPQAVPTGSYDRNVPGSTHPSAGQWQPEQNGTVLKVLNSPTCPGGMVNLSVDGSTEMNYATGVAPAITTSERQALACNGSTALYVQYETLWRIPVTHFSPWDLNWGAGPPPGAIGPPGTPPLADTPKDDPCETEGSIIECENQVLGEDIPIVGTPYSLHYRSETQNGYHPTIAIPVYAGGSAMPTSVKRIEAEVQVAGQDAVLQGTVTTNTTPQTLYWSWDRTDAYHRLVQGAAIAHVEVRYVYDAVPMKGGNFADYPNDAGLQGVRNTREITYSTNYDIPIGAFDDQGLGLGGWTISVQHVYQPTSGTLYKGTGEKRSPNQRPDVIHQYVADSRSDTYLYKFGDVAATADGNVYVAHESDCGGSGACQSIAKISNGTLTDLQLTATSQNFTDGAAVSTVVFDQLTHVVAEPTGNLLVSDYCRIVRVTADPDLKAYLVAGSRSGTSACRASGGFAADGAVAANTALNQTLAVTEDPDGSVVFAEWDQTVNALRIRRVAPNGKLETIAGGGSTALSTCASTPCYANAVQLSGGSAGITAITAGPDATIYFADGTGTRVWQIYPRDGKIYPFAGNGTSGWSGDGKVPSTPTVPASTDATVSVSNIVGLSMNGKSVILSGGDYTVRRVDPSGTISTIAGIHASGSPFADGLVPTQTHVYPTSAVIGPDGYYYTTSVTPTYAGPDQVVRFRYFSDLTSGSTTIADPGGAEAYRLDSNGRHSLTLSRFSGATVRTLAYDANGHLTTITEGNDSAGTTISGYCASPINCSSTVTITSPRGQVTTLAQSGGYLTAISDPIPSPNTGIWKPTHSSGGLLTKLIEPNDAIDSNHHTHTFKFSANGQLVSDANPASPSGTQLNRSVVQTNYAVGLTTPQGRTTTHTVDRSPTSTDIFNGAYPRIEARTHVDPVGLTTTDYRYSDGTHKVTFPDSTTTYTSFAPDPRFGFSAPYASVLTTTTSSAAHSGTNAYSQSRSRTTSPALCTGPFSCTTVTDAVWGNDTGGSSSQYTSVWTAASGTILKTSPVGRSVQYTLDALERPTQIAVQGSDPTAIYPVCITYGSASNTYEMGQVIKIQQGGGSSCSTNARTVNLNHYTSGGAKGFISTINTPLASPTVNYSSVDNDGRATTVGFPGRTINMMYDLNGNMLWLEQPKGASYKHNFTYNGLNLLGSYQPPQPTAGDWNTNYDYDADGLGLDVQPPGVYPVSYARDAAGRVYQTTYNHPTSGTVVVSTNFDATTGMPCTSASGAGLVRFSV